MEDQQREPFYLFLMKAMKTLQSWFYQLNKLTYQPIKRRCVVIISSFKSTHPCRHAFYIKINTTKQVEILKHKVITYLKWRIHISGDFYME